MMSHWPESHVEFIWEEELLLPELLVFCPLVALGCRCTLWLEPSLLFSLWLAPALLRTADRKKTYDEMKDQKEEELFWLQPYVYSKQHGTFKNVKDDDEENRWENMHSTYDVRENGYSFFTFS